MINLKNAVYDSQTGAGTKNVVTAVENDKGVIIKRAYVAHAGLSSKSEIQIDGNTFIGNSIAIDGVQFEDNAAEIFVPKGNSIALVNTGTYSFSNIWYEVLS